jgi:transposase
MTAVTQIRYPNTEGRAYFDRKTAEGKTAKEALRALKRQVSDAFYKHLKADAARAASSKSPGGHAGNDSVASAAGSHPETPALRPGHSRTKTHGTLAIPARE